MYLVQIVATLAMGHRIADDAITDLIEALVDELDGLDLEPSVGTGRSGDNVTFTVDVTVDQAEEFEALTVGVAAIKAAFRAAGVGTAQLPVVRDLRSRVMPMQPA
ncbi:MAG: hypothetical protein ACR2HM_01565 [Acidimicrobiales bacterium]